MGKCLTSLLVLAACFILPNEVSGDEQVRRVQEELRKRHLFYAEANGEKGAALAVALKHYQAKKGFAPTGQMDPGTLASLGLPAPPPGGITPAIALKRGELHGANGEQLPNCPPRSGPKDDASDQMTAGIIGRDYVQLELAEFARQSSQRPGPLAKPARITNFSSERSSSFNATLGLAERNRATTSTLVWTTLALQGDPEISGEADQVGVKRMDRTRGLDRPSHRRPNLTRPHKERNPLVLTYQSVDRAMRSLFGDPHAKKKRPLAKRL